MPRIDRLIRLVVPLGVAVAMAGCSAGVLDPAGPVAAGERTILLNSLVIMLGIVIPTIVLTIGFAWWFRAGNDKATHLPDWSYSGRLELLVWSIPLLVIIFLGGIAWISSHTLDPSRALRSERPPLDVQVVSLDWKWLFIYPGQGVASVNRLVIPVGTPVRFRITSATVMNSFFIPQLGSQIYAMSGMDAKLNLLADRRGRYQGLSAHYSGEGFANMTFAVDAVSPAQFTGWIARTKGHGPALEGRTYLHLAGVEGNVAPFTFGSVRPGLYEAALHQSGAPVQEHAHHGKED